MQVQTEGNPTSCTYALRKDVQDQLSLKNQHTSKTSKETDFSLCALFFQLHSGLIGSSLRLLWAGGLQASATCTTYDELRGSRPPEGSSDHSGGLGSKTYPACKNSGLKSEASEAPGRWTSYRARLMEQCAKMSPFHDRFVLLPLEKEAHLYAKVPDKWDMLIPNSVRKIQFVLAVTQKETI